MIFTYDLSLPANTTVRNPVKQDMLLGYGIIDNVLITFPAGCQALAGVKIKRGLHSVLPAGHNKWFKGNDANINLYTRYELTDYPYILTLEGYNIDDTYGHNIIIMLSLVPPVQGERLIDFDDLEDYE
jgi:hypothetical protein